MIQEDLHREIDEVEALLRELAELPPSESTRIAEALGELFIVRRRRELLHWEEKSEQ